MTQMTQMNQTNMKTKINLKRVPMTLSNKAKAIQTNSHLTKIKVKASNNIKNIITARDTENDKYYLI